MKLWMTSRVTSGFLAAAVLLGIVVAAGAGTAAAQGVSQADIELRDNLIADQEALLNVYRCRFDIDTQIVPGGCTNGAPSNPAIRPGGFRGAPTEADKTARDALITAQEALLNVYRCRFDIDTQIVPGGCTNGQPAPAPFQNQQEQATPDTSEQFPPQDIPGQSVAITVPAAAPSGRCAPYIARGIYEWEECAWAKHWENPEFNYSLSDSEAQAIIDRIWTEVAVDGKPATPPTNNLVPAGSTCATPVDGGFIIGCYQPEHHHIRRLDAFLDTLLHEVAHAMVRDHPSVQACQQVSDPHENGVCVHNDIFRCVTEHLYTNYGRIPAAGVCGTATESPTYTPHARHAWETYFHDDGTITAGVPAFEFTLANSFQEFTAWLLIQCHQDETDILFYIDAEGLEDQEERGGRILVEHFFAPSNYLSWDEQRQLRHAEDNQQENLWYPSVDNLAGFLPDHLEENFINQIVDSDLLVLDIEVWGQTYFGTLAFELYNAYNHIRPVTEHCGWRWS